MGWGGFGVLGGNCGLGVWTFIFLRWIAALLFIITRIDGIIGPGRNNRKMF